NDVFEYFLALSPLCRVGRQKKHADSVLTRPGEFYLRFFGDQLEKSVRWLDENACTITGIGLAAAGSSMVQVQQDLKGLLNDGVRLTALDIDDEPYAARFM